MVNSIKQVLQYSKKLDLGLRLWEILPSRDFNTFYNHYKTFRTASEKCIAQSGRNASDDSLVSDLKLSGRAEMRIEFP